MGASVRIDLSRAKRKLSHSSIQNGRHEMANKAHLDMNERFVPMRSQHLRDMSFVESNGEKITWNARYALAHYHGGFTNKFGTQVIFSDYTTPGTGPYWDKEAKSIFMSSWLEAFKRGANW
ncbi:MULTISPECIES: minor capsid protein [Enterococcus]|uniref:minor capsid protein n=1 Tax=Enterococcus TaxID=1350 RepID=UPI001CCD0144|nr:minor capsid protein [Enterococcus mundtii]MCA6773570.1 minor capsid protein [Enterococcus mundtii]MDK4210220.1 minor capsid protein [Enterococcus mundtii]UBM05128.1 minor capsid protein [Enterococcus mundtii]GKS55271.1 minor capsid protein [Enterococcus mundtii]